MEGVATVRGSENRAASRQNATYVLEREFEGLLWPDQAIETIGNADDLPSILNDGGFGGGTNYGVETGSVAASGADADTANFRHRYALEILGLTFTILRLANLDSFPLPWNDERPYRWLDKR